MFNNENKIVFGFKKSKVLGLCGAALAVFVLGQQSASANEVVTSSADSTVSVTNLNSTEAVESEPVSVTTETTSSEVAPVSSSSDSISTTASSEIMPETASLRSADVATVEAPSTDVVPSSSSVANETTAVISSNPTTSQSSNDYNVKVETKLTDNVVAGQYVDYTFNNLPVGSLNGQTVSTSDGLNIGTLNVIDWSEEPLRNPDDTVSGDTIYSTGVVRLTFNEAVNNLTNISYAFEYLNKNFEVYRSTDAYTVKTSVSVDGKVVGQYDAPVNASSKEEIITNAIYDPGFTNGVVSNDTITPTQLVLGLISGTENSIKAGSTVTYSLTESSSIGFDTSSIQPGQKVLLFNQTAYTDGSYVNPNNIIFDEQVNKEAEVVSVSDNQLVLKVTDDLGSGEKYGIALLPGFVVKADASQIDTTNNRITGVNVQTSIKDSTGSEQASYVQENSYAQLTGDKVSASAVDKQGDVVVHYRDQAGNQIADWVSVVPVTKVGVPYDTTAYKKDTLTLSDGRSYLLRSVEGSETGVVVSGRTDVVYVYEEIKGDVVVHYRDQAGNQIADWVVDTDITSTGVAYDTTDHKKEVLTLSDGRSYLLRSVEGSETGVVVSGRTDVVYVYEEIKGDVVVHYRDQAGNQISDWVVDTDITSTGVAYDTTDHKKEKLVTADGKTYKLVSTVGSETGVVVSGRTDVVYVYTEVKGSVLVRYVDQDGNEILKTVEDTPETSTGVEYNTKDHKIEMITTPDGKKYKLVEIKGSESGKVVEGETVVTYVYEEVVSKNNLEKPKTTPTTPTTPTSTPTEPGLVKESSTSVSAAISETSTASQSVGTLPQTGEVTSVLGALGTVFSSLGLAGLGLKRGKKDAE